jgi:hypothetical protein
MHARPSMLFLSAGALAVSAQVVAVAPARGAEPTWGPTVVVAEHPRGASLAVDARNRAAVAWESREGAIMVARRRADGTWGASKQVGWSGAAMASPRVAADADGNLTVAWITQRPGFTDGVKAATQTHAGWSHPVRLSEDLKVASYPQDGKGAWGADTVRLAVTPKGAATVAWNWGSEARNKPWRIQAVFHRPGGRWGGVAHVTRPTGAHLVDLGIAEGGTTTLLAARQPLGHPQSLRAHTRRPGHAWSGPTVVTPRGYAPKLAVDRAGDAIVVFMPTIGRVMASYRPHHGHWRAPHQLTPAGAPAHEVSALAMNGPGSAMVAWADRHGRIDVVRRPPHGSWSAPVRVVSTHGMVSNIAVALNGAGDGLLTWGEYGLYAAYRPHAARWGVPTTLSPNDGVDVLESIDARVTRNGNAVVMWKQEGMPIQMRVRTAS